MPTDPRDIKIEQLTQALTFLKNKEERDALFTGIGYALSGFSRIEEGLVAVTATLLQAQPRKVGFIMYSILNFRAWLAIIDHFFAEDEIFGALAPKWQKISSGIDKIKDDRDRFAHHTALGEEGGRVFLAPSKLDRRTKSIKHAQAPLSTEMVYDFIAKVTRLANELTSLQNAMKAIQIASKGRRA
jgi:hypothetical protein